MKYDRERFRRTMVLAAPNAPKPKVGSRLLYFSKMYMNINVPRYTDQ